MFRKFQSLLFNLQLQKLFVYGFGQLINLAIPLLVVPYIVKISGEENFGKTAIGMSIAFFLIVFTDFGSDILGVRQVSVSRNNPEELNRTISLNYILKLSILVFFVLLFLVLASRVDYLKHEKNLFLLSLTIVIGQFLNPSWILQGLEDFGFFSFFSVLSKVLYAAFTFLLLKEEADYIFVNFSLGIGVVLSSIIALFYLKHRYKIQFVKISKNEIAAYFRANYSFVISQIFTWIQLYFPVILIGLIGGELLAGQFRVVDQILSIFKTFVIVSFNFVFPKVCYELGQKNRKLWSWKFYNLGIVSLVVFFSLITYVFSFQLMDFYNTTNRYFLNNLLRISLVYPIIFCIAFAFKQLLLAGGENKIYSRITVVMSIITILGIVFTFDKFGLFGVFYTLIFVELMTVMLFFLLVKRKKIF